MSQRFLLVSAASFALSLLLCSCNDRDECCEPCPRSAPPPPAAGIGAPAQNAIANSVAKNDRAAAAAREFAQMREDMKALALQLRSSQPPPQRGWFPSLLDFLKTNFSPTRKEPTFFQRKSSGYDSEILANPWWGRSDARSVSPWQITVEIPTAVEFFKKIGVTP